MYKSYLLIFFCKLPMSLACLFFLISLLVFFFLILRSIYMLGDEPFMVCGDIFTQCVICLFNVAYSVFSTQNSSRVSLHHPLYLFLLFIDFGSSAPHSQVIKKFTHVCVQYLNGFIFLHLHLCSIWP